MRPGTRLALILVGPDASPCVPGQEWQLHAKLGSPVGGDNGSDANTCPDIKALRALAEGPAGEL